jgi:hypothetical protein
VFIREKNRTSAAIRPLSKVEWRLSFVKTSLAPFQTS